MSFRSCFTHNTNVWATLHRELANVNAHPALHAPAVQGAITSSAVPRAAACGLVAARAQAAAPDVCTAVPLLAGPLHQACARLGHCLQGCCEQQRGQCVALCLRAGRSPAPHVPAAQVGPPVGVMPLDADTRTWWSQDETHGIGMRVCEHLTDAVRVRCARCAAGVTGRPCKACGMHASCLACAVRTAAWHRTGAGLGWSCRRCRGSPPARQARHPAGRHCGGCCCGRGAAAGPDVLVQSCAVSQACCAPVAAGPGLKVCQQADLAAKPLATGKTQTWFVLGG